MVLRKLPLSTLSLFKKGSFVEDWNVLINIPYLRETEESTEFHEKVIWNLIFEGRL